jgi:hypothetical protein
LTATVARSPQHKVSPFPPRALGPSAFHGRPLVVCCAERWAPPNERALRRLRSELRGLGAALVVLLPDRISCLGPNEESFGLESELACDRAAFEALFRPRPDHGIRPELALLILNPSGDVVWSHTPEPDPNLQYSEALIEALSGARRRLQQSAGRSFAVTRRELVTSLIGAFAMTFGDACRPSTPAPPATEPPSGSGAAPRGSLYEPRTPRAGLRQ